MAEWNQWLKILTINIGSDSKKARTKKTNHSPDNTSTTQDHEGEDSTSETKSDDEVEDGASETGKTEGSPSVSKKVHEKRKYLLDVLKTESPDIVFLQEVPLPSLIKAVWEMAGYKSFEAIGKKYKHESQSEWSAILYRIGNISGEGKEHEIKEKYAETYYYKERYCPATLTLKTEKAGSQKIKAISWHGPNKVYVDDVINKKKDILKTFLEKEAAEEKGEWILIGGDFNLTCDVAKDCLNDDPKLGHLQIVHSPVRKSRSIDFFITSKGLTTARCMEHISYEKFNAHYPITTYVTASEELAKLVSLFDEAHGILNQLKECIIFRQPNAINAKGWTQIEEVMGKIKTKVSPDGGIDKLSEDITNTKISDDASHGK